MTPQEIQKQNIETPQIKTEKIEVQSIIPKSDILKTYKEYELFSRTLNQTEKNTKEHLLYILSQISEDDLKMYLELNLDGRNLFDDKAINEFIKEYGKTYPIPVISHEDEKKSSNKAPEIKDNFNTDNLTIQTNSNNKEDPNSLQAKMILEKERRIREEENLKANQENLKANEGIELLQKNDSKYRELFKGDANIIQILDDIKANEKDPEKVAELLNEFLSKKENATKFFDTIAKSGDKALYEETISSFKNLGVTIPAYISPTPSIPEPVIPTDPIVSQFPGAKPEDIEKRGNLVSYRDKTIDTETGKAYISGEGGYAIETSMKVPNSLDLRVKYQKERLEILDEIKTNEKIISEVDEYQETLKYEKYLNAQYEKLALNHDIDSNLAKAEIESKLITIKKYKELVEERYPKIKENPEEIKNKANNEIKKLKEKLTALKTKFDEDMQKLLEAGQDEILAKDQKIRETMSFLDDLGITNINQNDLQKIIDRINIHPHAYGFSKPIDLKAGFEGSPTDALKQKKEFFHLFSKIYEKMNFDPPVKSSIIDGFTKDERLKDDTKFKQKLEDIGVTRGGAIQIETVMNILGEKPEERERVYNGKPTQKEKVSETVETK